MKHVVGNMNASAFTYGARARAWKAFDADGIHKQSGGEFITTLECVKDAATHSYKGRSDQKYCKR